MPVEEATSGPSEPIPCITAFTVYQLPNGLWQVTDDINAPLVPERVCNSDDVTAGAAITVRDAATREVVTLIGQQIVPAIVQNVIQGQMQVAGAIRQQAESAKLAQQLEEDKKRRGGR